MVRSFAFRFTISMKEGGSIVSVILARAGSKRVPGKNRRMIRGVPLVDFSIRAALAAETCDHVVVSTDDPSIAERARNYEGVILAPRPPELATDTASSFSVLRHIDQLMARDYGIRVDLMVLLQPTNPLRRQGMIDRGVAMVAADSAASSLVAVREERLFTGLIKDGYWIPNFAEHTRSQDIPPVYIPTGNLYIYRCDQTIRPGDALGSRSLPLIENETFYVNIDYESDFAMLEHVLDVHREPFSYLL